MKNCKAVIYDLDGTLVDTEPAAAAAVIQCFSRWGVSLEPADSHAIIGRTWESASQILFDKYQLPISAQDASREMVEAYRDLLDSKLVIVPGAAQSVRGLAGHFRLALVSGSHRREILWALTKLGVLEHFELILGAEDYPRSKPAPDGYLQAMRKLGVSPEDTLIFEDSTPGIASGIAAGAQVVAINCTNSFHQDTSQAHHHIQDLSGVSPDWVRQLK